MADSQIRCRVFKINLCKCLKINFVLFSSLRLILSFLSTFKKCTVISVMDVSVFSCIFPHISLPQNFANKIRQPVIDVMAFSVESNVRVSSLNSIIIQKLPVTSRSSKEIWTRNIITADEYYPVQTSTIQ